MAGARVLREDILMRRMLKIVSLSLAALACSQVVTAHQLNQPYTPSAAQVQKTKERFAAILATLRQTAQQAAQSPEMQREIGKVTRTAEQIANPQMNADHNKLLRFLGINPDGSSALYIFVSWSMPLTMLRAYEVDSMWSGAPLVFRGIPPHVSLRNFILKDLRKLVWGKGYGADISIDPRLFDLYAVTTVPTIVLAKRTKQFSCAIPVMFKHGKSKTLSYDKCSKAKSSDFIKIEGAVTTWYALRKFLRNGWPSARQYMNALRKGYKGREPSAREQIPFKGKWALVKFPRVPKTSYP